MPDAPPTTIARFPGDLHRVVPPRLAAGRTIWVARRDPRPRRRPAPSLDRRDATSSTDRHGRAHARARPTAGRDDRPVPERDEQQAADERAERRSSTIVPPRTRVTTRSCGRTRRVARLPSECPRRVSIPVENVDETDTPRDAPDHRRLARHRRRRDHDAHVADRPRSVARRRRRRRRARPPTFTTSNAAASDEQPPRRGLPEPARPAPGSSASARSRSRYATHGDRGPGRGREVARGRCRARRARVAGLEADERAGDARQAHRVEAARDRGECRRRGAAARRAARRVHALAPGSATPSG